jgi:hypothetical protein
VIPTDERFQRIWTFLRGRIAVPVISMHMLCGVPAWCQRMSSSLGPVVDLELPFTPAGVAAMRVTGTSGAALAVVQREPAIIHLYKLTPAGELMATRMLRMEGTAAPVLLAADLTGDGTDELIALTADPAAVVIHSRSRKGFDSRTISLAAPVEGCTVADINNDRRPDILLFGRTTSGVQTLLRQANGSYAQGPLLFPDVSVSDLAAADLNADYITDLVLADWLSDRLLTVYGIGRGVFSEQAAIALEGEPTRVALTPLTRTRTFGVAVSLAPRNATVVYEGDATGNLNLIETLTLPEPVLELRTSRLTADQLPDLLALTHSAVSVATGIGEHTFSTPVAFGLGSDLAGVVAADMDGDRLTDVACVDRATRRLIVLGNAAGEKTSWPAVYAVGIDPRGLAVHDVTGDGIDDIIVANRGSANLSLLAGSGGGRFRGQEAIVVPPEPVSVFPVGSPDTPVRTLITSHASGDIVTIVRLDPGSDRFLTASVPTGARPYVMLAKGDSTHRTFEMLVRYEHGNNRSLSLSLFEKAGTHQFVERSLRPNVAGRVVALTVDDVTRNGYYDLVFVTRERTDGNGALSLAMSDSGFDFRSIHRLLDFADPGGTAHSIMTGFVDRDEDKDILIFFGEPRNAVGILYGRGNGTFRDSLDWIRNIRPAGDDVVLLRDLDGNGATDMACIDERLEAVVVVYQKEEGGFQAPAHGATGMRIAPLRSAGRNDVILARGGSGTVSIIFDPFRK